jgi:hypothetical protein
MKNNVYLKFIIIRCICLAIIIYLTGFIANFLPDVRLIRVIEAIIMLIVAAISLLFIGRYEKKSQKKNNSL